MALVVLLKGVNVGGHRTFRPSVLARQMRRFHVVNVGTAGTLVIHRRIGRTALRAELMRRLPLETEVMICEGRDLLRLAAGDPFAGQPSSPDIFPPVARGEYESWHTRANSCWACTTAR